jgi:hypothetical protein
VSGQVLLSLVNEGKILMLDAHKGGVLAQFVQFGVEDWAVLTSDNHFDGSSRGMGFVLLLEKGKEVDNPAFKEKFRKQGIMSTYLRTSH